MFNISNMLILLKYISLKILLCFFCFITIINANAQILNIDKSDTSDYIKKFNIKFNFATGLEVDKQKITLWDATNTAELMVQKNKELFIFAGSSRITYNGPDDILNAGYLHLRYRHNYKNKFQPETFIQYQWDNKRGLVYRRLGGMNIRYNIWRGDKWDFNAGLGLMYEEEKWNYDGVDSSKISPNPKPIINNLIKLNSYIRFDWKPNQNNDIAINIFIQTRTSIFQPRIAPHIQWNINAGKHIAFSISLSGIYDIAPVVPIDHFYYSFSNSIIVKI